MRFKADQKWLLNSPDLLRLDSALSAQGLLKKCRHNHSFEFKPTYRLGVYFEQLWAHLVTNSNSLSLLHKNLQIIINKHTYGEFDSIIVENQKNIHCELAVKFYLQIGKGDKLSDWVGPNLKDRFDDKYKRLFEHQLRLSTLPEIQTWLKQKALKIEQQKLLTRGRLFYPYRKFIEQEFVYPQQVNSLHDKGFWIHYSELEALLSDKTLQWYQLPRFYWLGPVEKLDDQLLAVEQAFSGFSLQKIVALKGGKEIMRGFVVNDDWLYKAQQRVLD